MVEQSSKRKATDPPLLSSSMVITVGSGTQAIKLAKAGIVIYGVRYRTSPFLDSDLDSICASCYKLGHHTHLCDPELNPPRCKFCALPHPTNTNASSQAVINRASVNTIPNTAPFAA